jgi:hypothetical protein
MSASGGRCAPDRGYNVNPAIYASDHSAYQAAAFQVAIGCAESAPRSLAGGDDLIHSA